MRRVGLLALASLVLALPAAAAPGDLDRTFSGDGWVRSYDITGYSRGFLPKGAEDVAIQADGKILAVSEILDGNSHWYFGVYRWLPNGDLDRSFGSGGWVANDLGIFPMPHTVALQKDGKILVGGQIECPDLQLCFGIVRYHPNGSVDSSFGISGIARATFPGWRCGCELHDLAVPAERADRGGRLAIQRRRCAGRHAPRGRPIPAGRQARRELSPVTGGSLSISATATTSVRRSPCSADGRIVVGGVASFGTEPRPTSQSSGCGRTARSTGRSRATASRA